MVTPDGLTLTCKQEEGVAEGKLRVLFTREDIREYVNELALAVRRDYGDKNPLFLGVLKGSFVFLADLVRAVGFPLEVDLVRLASYGASTYSSGQVRMLLEPTIPVKGRHVLVVDDIVDTGICLRYLLDYLADKGTASLKVCVLFNKKERRQVQVRLDYVGAEVPDLFVVGYGLDFAERYRHLPDLCALEMQEDSGASQTR